MMNEDNKEILSYQKIMMMTEKDDKEIFKK
jgi:hypothetical protein